MFFGGIICSAIENVYYLYVLYPVRLSRFLAMTQLIPISHNPIGEPLRLLLDNKRSEATKRAYSSDLAFFILYVYGTSPTPEAINSFLTLDQPEMFRALNDYKSFMIGQKLAEATVNRRLSAIRALMKIGFQLGICVGDGRGIVSSEKVQSYRNTKGPSLAVIKKMIELPAKHRGRGTVGALRDKAILLMMFTNGIRAGELVRLDVEDYKPESETLAILGKGMGTQKLPVTLSRKTMDALDAYLDRSGHKEGALFLNDMRCNKISGKHRRLTYIGLYYTIKHYGKLVGQNITPHMIRHSAVTNALDAMGGDYRKAQKFARHKDIRTTMIYDDNRLDHQGEVTNVLDGLL